ncbi:NADP-dependent oxidoreductase domain-containing protein [Butyriboletus roseoflavus]|nr:NADP-dependent oxidoreductase domain-containing protein [Butyriboletus roseoflavus]
MSTPKVEYRQLGKSGLRVSVPVLGAMSFGSSKWSPWVLEEEPSLKILKAAWNLGVNTIDTANLYSNGESERIVAKFIQKYQIPRHQIVIASKCYGIVAEDVSVSSWLIPDLKESPLYVNQSGLSRAAIFNAVEASLARLGTSYLDLLQIHRYDPEVPAEETMKALHDLIQSGKVRYIGASSMRCWQFAHLNEVAEKNGWTKFVSMQNEYSLLYREEEREMLAYCRFNGIGVIPWAPLAAGDLARPIGTKSVRHTAAKGTKFEKKFSEADKTIINRVEELANKKGVKMGQIALAWVGQKVASPIVGVNSIERLKESIVTDITLTPEEVTYLEEPYACLCFLTHALCLILVHRYVAKPVRKAGNCRPCVGYWQRMDNICSRTANYVVVIHTLATWSSVFEHQACRCSTAGFIVASATPSTPKSKSQMLPADTQPFSSQSDYRTGHLFLGHQTVLKALGRYLQVPYATLIRLAFGSPPDTSQICQKLTEDGILNVLPDGKTSQWASVLESVAFQVQPLVEIISTVFNQIPSCQVAFAANSSATPLSERRNTSRPDAHIIYPAKNETHWFDIAIPFEFKKTKDCSAKRDNEQKLIWSLHHIMREDPLRRLALGITIEDMDMRIWYSNRAFLAVSVPVDFATGINDIISLFYLIGSANKEKLGWDPTVKRVLVGQEIQYKFEIDNQSFITTRPLAMYGADAIVGRGTRVYEARDENRNIVAIKDSWRDEDRELEGVILEKIFKDIRDQLGEQKVAEAEKYFVRVLVYEDVVISGALDETLDLREVGDAPLERITIDVDPILSEKRHLLSIPDSVRPPTELAQWRVRPPSVEVPCRVHTRTVFEEVGTSLMNVTRLADAFSCLSGALRALYYLHKAGGCTAISVSPTYYGSKRMASGLAN